MHLFIYFDATEKSYMIPSNENITWYDSEQMKSDNYIKKNIASVINNI